MSDEDRDSYHYHRGRLAGLHEAANLLRKEAERPRLFSFTFRWKGFYDGASLIHHHFQEVADGRRNRSS